MLWYGYIYYLFGLLLLVVLLASFLKVMSSTSLYVTETYRFASILFAGSLNCFALVTFSIMYGIFENFTTFKLSLNTSVLAIDSISYQPNDLLLNTSYLDLHFSSVYYFPFIYIFVIVTFLSLFFCLAYNKDELLSFTLFCFIILLAGYTLFYTDSLILFFMAYEMLLIPSFFILYKFAKTRRSVEAAYLMFFWTQFGAMFIIFSFMYLFFVTGLSTFTHLSLYNLNTFELNFVFMCLFIGFGVKFPIWPFYGWLPKAHVEASTNFSIFLSGVLVKFAFFGFLKVLLTIQLEPTFYFVYPFLTIGIVDAVFKLFYQIDLKKLVAYSTVVEMHWLTICILSGQSALMLASFSMLISHALLSTNSFLLVDAIGRRFKTRLVTEVGGINFLCPKLFSLGLLNLLIFLGFPGTIMFISEILFFSFFFDFNPQMCLLYIVLLYLIGPTMFFRSWLLVLFGQSAHLSRTIPVDLLSREVVVYGGLIVLMIWLGISWQSFLF